MAIHRPERRLLHNIPLRFVRDRVSGHGRKGVNHEIPLIPFIDFLIVLVIFLLMSFSASGELVAQQASIQLAQAVNSDRLEQAPIIAIDAAAIALDGVRVADTPTQAASAEVEPIEGLVSGLETARDTWTTLHPADEFPARVILQVDKAIDFRVVKKAMFSAALAGYPNVSFAVNEAAADEAAVE